MDEREENTRTPRDGLGSRGRSDGRQPPEIETLQVVTLLQMPFHQWGGKGIGDETIRDALKVVRRVNQLAAEEIPKPTPPREG